MERQITHSGSSSAVRVAVRNRASFLVLLTMATASASDADEDDEDRHERRTEGVKVLGRHLVPLPTGRDALPIRVPEASQRARAEGARKELHAEESEDEHREDQQEREVAGGHERSADREEDLAQALEGARELERTEDSKHA